MAGRYTEKTEISFEDYLKLEGLLVLGREANARCDAIIHGIAGILGESHGDGHASDAVYSDYTARDLLGRSGITVLPEADPKDP